MKKLLTLALAVGVLAVLMGPNVVQMDAHNDTTGSLTEPTVLTDPAVAPQGWSVAIEQNAMLTNCGSTTNIPVAGATDCTTAKAAAWNLLTTLLQTPNCLSSGCPPGYTISQGVSTCTPDPYTRPNGSPAMRWQVSWTWTCVPPPCCNYTFDLSTGQGNGPQDPLWTVNLLPTYIITSTTSVPSWLTVPFVPARWIQKKNSPTPMSHLPGTYKYKVRFNIPACPAGNVQLDGKFAADNSANVFLDGTQITTTPCLHNCFKATQAPVSLSIPSIMPGPHTLLIKVINDGGFSGLVVNAQLTRKCP